MGLSARGPVRGGLICGPQKEGIERTDIVKQNENLYLRK